MPRYLVKAGTVTYRTPAGATNGELWFGIETPGPVNLEFLSRNGYDLVPAEGLSREELRSVGVDTFEEISVDVETE